MAVSGLLIALLIFKGFHGLIKADGGYIPFGPEFKATIGEIWPNPQSQISTGRYYELDPQNFEIVAVNNNCDILEEAIKRYTEIIKESANGWNTAPQTDTIGTVEQLRVDVHNACETLPHLDMDESYEVHGDGRVIANSVWGALHGLETLSHLLVPMPNGRLRIAETEIHDAPRFKYRGLMVDSARHFISKQKILQIIDGMSYNKLNTFHWHITDDSAFPYNSDVFPELSAKGAYKPELAYSMDDVREIVEYARLRGVRVVAEFDTPAHTASWGASHPELMTECFGEYAGQLGPFNPTLDHTYEFLNNFFSEIRTIFPETYIHLGGDEVASGCWETNPQIQSYLDERGLDDGDLSNMYWGRFTALISALGWKQIFWQEPVVENRGFNWPANAIVQVWHDYAQLTPQLTQDGHEVIRSDGWYLDSIDMGADWEKFYGIEPTDFDGTRQQKKRIIGGEACLWGEWINEHNILPTAFPRVSAVAERLWSRKSLRNENEARARLEEHNCRMINRGIEARPANGYGLC